MDVFGNLLVTTIWIFFLVAYLMLLFFLLSDLFRDQELAGGWKALWVVALILFPLLAALIYLIARGGGMQERAADEAKKLQATQDEYIRRVADPSDPADQIAKAKQLHESGVIDDSEFARLKAKALA